MKRVVIEPIPGALGEDDEPFDAEAIMDFVINELDAERLHATVMLTGAEPEALEPSEKQALKHFDELLRAAQEVVNDASAPGEHEWPDDEGPGVDDRVDHGLIAALKAIVQQISDEAVEIIKGEAARAQR